MANIAEKEALLKRLENAPDSELSALLGQDFKTTLGTIKDNLAKNKKDLKAHSWDKTVTPEGRSRYSPQKPSKDFGLGNTYGPAKPGSSSRKLLQELGRGKGPVRYVTGEMGDHIFFHGSPFKGAKKSTDFKSNRPEGEHYFTTSKSVAKEYTNIRPSAEKAQLDVKFKKGKTVYTLKIDIPKNKTFDTTNPEHVKIYQEIKQQIRKENPNNPDEWIPKNLQRTPTIKDSLTDTKGHFPGFGTIPFMIPHLKKRGFKGAWVSEGSQGASFALFDPSDAKIINIEPARGKSKHSPKKPSKDFGLGSMYGAKDISPQGRSLMSQIMGSKSKRYADRGRRELEREFTRNPSKENARRLSNHLKRSGERVAATRLDIRKNPETLIQDNKDLLSSRKWSEEEIKNMSDEKLLKLSTEPLSYPKSFLDYKISAREIDRRLDRRQNITFRAQAFGDISAINIAKQFDKVSIKDASDLIKETAKKASEPVEYLMNPREYYHGAERINRTSSPVTAAGTRRYILNSLLGKVLKKHNERASKIDKELNNSQREIWEWGDFSTSIKQRGNNLDDIYAPMPVQNTDEFYQAQLMAESHGDIFQHPDEGFFNFPMRRRGAEHMTADDRSNLSDSFRELHYLSGNFDSYHRYTFGMTKEQKKVIEDTLDDLVKVTNIFKSSFTKGAWREFIQEENDDHNVNPLYPDSVRALYTREDFNTSGSVEYGPSQQARHEAMDEARRLLEEGDTQQFTDNLLDSFRRIFEED